MTSPAIDYRGPARDALDRARLGIGDAIAGADPADIPLLWATLGTGLAVMAVSGAVMSTGTAIARAIDGLKGELVGLRRDLKDGGR